jgi:uncharacterized protein YfaS (alpha-2-macroglobulin family)/tetratricopeptide (TPR) repeat protein
MKSLFGSVIILSLLSLSFGPRASAADTQKPTAKPSADTPLVADNIREAMQDRRYADAVTAIDEALTDEKAPKNAPRDYLTYLKGRALHLDGKYDDAIAVYDQFPKQFAKSPWARRARFAKAVSLARKGDFRSAELIYRDEAEFLLSSERKQQLADIYLEFADSYFKPPKEEQKPDYAKALEFYKKALDTGAKPARQAQVELRIGECLQNLNRFGEAAVAFEKFIKDHPGPIPSDNPPKGPTVQLPSWAFYSGQIEARYRLGVCRLAEGNQREARRVWQDLLAWSSESGKDRGNWPRVDDAQFDLSRTWNIPNPQNDEQLNLGTAALRTFLERFPTHKNAGRAHLEIAQSYLARGRAADAVAALKQFLSDAHTRDSKELPDAQNLLGTAYRSQKDFDKALAAWREFLGKYPAHGAWTSVQQQIIETEYARAAELLAAKKYDEANKLFAEFLAKYPLDSRAAQILLAMNQKNVAEEKWDDAIAAWRKIVSKYPGGTNEASIAQFLIADTLERKLGKLEEALEEYRKVTGGVAQGRAMQAAARLTAKTMTVATERVFRSDETPKLKLVSRNVESVTVRVYKVDLETYFRKMHLARGVEGLDISLIDPDQTFEFKVPKYAKHQEIESEIALVVPPLGGKRGDTATGPAKAGTTSARGVMAVTVSSKALEATTMVMQSDLDVIVKSSRDEIFVFAENMLTGKPWPGTHLLISNGHEVIGEGTTDEHGIFRKNYKDFPATSGGGIVFGPGGGENNSAPNVGPTPNAPPTDPSYPQPQQVVPPSPPQVPPPMPAPSASTGPLTATTTASPSAEPLGSFGRPVNPLGPPPSSGPAHTNDRLTLVAGVGTAESAPPVEPCGKPLNTEDVRVFATIDGNVASNIVNLQGVGVAQGLTDKAYIYTDRPAYRAGQLVNIRGCLRRAVNDAFVIDKDKAYTVQVFDARNRPIRQEKIKLDAFGSFHVHFVLPPDSPQGQYRVLVHDNAAQNFQGTFLVHEYQLEPIRLVVDTPRRVYYRGEPIEGTIRAEFYYGAPVVGREIRYQLSGDRFETAKTDAKGEVKFKLDTREYSESQVLPLVVQMPEGNINTQVNFILAAQGFTIGVSTVRPVYVSGESLEATINVRDAENKPLAQKLTLKVLERTLVNGRIGERPVSEYELTTAADGKARQTIKLEKGGVYFLRAEAIDRFKNPISGQSAVQISGEDDLVRLRILADKHTYKVGDKAAVELFWREAPALALVTYQGARVLDYRLVELKTGANKLEIPMTAALAPNFELAVAVMNDPEHGAGSREQGAGEGEKGRRGEGEKKAKRPAIYFHTASSPFTVERDLRIKIATKRKTKGEGTKVRPGDDIEVTITTTDPQGRPVAAELSLAMVEQSLLERFASPLPGIGDFFRGGERVPAVRSTSSITFSYRPATQPINPRLLAEKDREEVAREEEESRKAAIAVASTTRAATANEIAGPGSIPGLSTAGGQNVLFGDAVNVHSIDKYDLAEIEDTPPPDLNVDPRLEKTSAVGGVLTVSGGTLATVNGSAWQLGDGKRAAYGQSLGRSYFAQRGPNDQLDARYVQGLNLGYEMNRAEPQQAANAEGKPAGQMYSFFVGLNNGANENANRSSGIFTADSTINFTQQGSSVLSLNGGNEFAGGTTITGLQISGLQAAGNTSFLCVDNSGKFRNVRLGSNAPDPATCAAMAAEFNASGAILLSALLPQETGYWNPIVTTGADGKTTLTLSVPERSTAWKFLAQGLTAETLAGEATDDLVVKKDLFGEIKLPLAFTDGDTAEIPVTVHNDAVDKGTIEVILKTTIGGRKVEEKRSVVVKGKGMEEVSFKTELSARSTGFSRNAASDIPPEGGTTSAQFELIVRAGGHEDTVLRSVPLKPYGVPVFRAASGSGTSDQTVWVEAPDGMPSDSAGMQIIIGPTVQRSLLDIVLAPAPWCQMEVGRLASGLESATSDAMASLGLQKVLGGSRDSGGPEAMALDSRIRGSISLLLSAQNDDGGWSWTGTPRAASNRYASCRVVWALTLVRQAGYVVPDDVYNKALGYLRNQSAATDNADYESKAILLHALAAAGQGDFALANRLYRDRNSLSSAALAHLALSFAAMDRKATAKEILDILEKRNLDDTATRRNATMGVLPWSGSPAELRALYALALEEIGSKSPKAKELIDWLMAHRTGNRWSPEKATGPAALALCRWFADNRFQGERYKLSVFVNDIRVKVLDIDPAAGSQMIDVPRKVLKAADGTPPANGHTVPATMKQRVNFQIEGRGQYTYQCILGGFVPADKLKSTTGDWRITRFYQPAPLELDGREIPRGFGVLEGSYQTFRNDLKQLPVGKRGMVDIELYRNYWNTPEERLEYLVVTEPIPSGATVIEKSVTGPFERYEIGPGEITFYVGSRSGLGTIHYELYGYVPGSYRVGPTIVRNAHRPEQLLVAAPKSLAVLPQEAKSSDPYRLTPQELYELGKRLAAKKDYAGAVKHLTDLVDNWNLRQDVYKDAVQTLLDAHLEIGPPNRIVHYFEIVKERWPNEEVPFAKIVKVGAAYHEMGEYERSYLVFRATVESNFARESEVAGFLDSQGELLRSLETMSNLLRNYPPEGYIAAAAYSLAQQVTAKAPEAANDPKLRQAKVNKVDLLRRGWTMLENFLTQWPDDPAADQAAFAAAGTLLDLKAYREAATACGRYAKRYEKSDLVDSYWYIIGYCEFAEGKHDAALEMCRKVAEFKHTDKSSGREIESPNKWQAIYILGQIHHGLGEAAAAIREYRRVEDRFADAKEAIAYFLRKSIELPEVATIKPGDKAEVELKFRNIPAVDVKVYRIDLMKFSLLRRNLGGIAQINLAGIRPLHETSVKLGDGNDYRDRTKSLDLPLKEEGAYLVVARGEDLHASGLVLVSPLAVEIQEDAVSGRVRTTVKDVKADHYVHNVQVKVIGSMNDDFVDGATDLRGVFVADGIHGQSTVIARAEGSRYAFFRGKSNLAPPAPPAPAAPGMGGGGGVPAPAQQPMSQEKALLQNVYDQNKAYQGQQQENLKRMYNAPSKGVEIKNAY